MNPGMNENTGINLPPPVGEQGASVPGLAPAEQAPASPEMAPTQAAPAQPAPVPQMPALPTMPAQTAVPIATDNASQSVVPVAIDDTDLIEKEWVTKAKQIVDSNREDPYKQSEEMNLFRADYMQKRYNKTIKVSK